MVVEVKKTEEAGRKLETKFISKVGISYPPPYIFILHKLLTHAYGMESQLALQGGGLQPKGNIGSNN